MARGWTLADSTVDALELADELKTYAREMVGESSVQLTSDRERILDGVHGRAGGGTLRRPRRDLQRSRRQRRGACRAVVEVDGPGIDVPAIPQFPRSAPVLVTVVARWDDAAAAKYVTAEYVVRPLGAIRVTAAGTYRIVRGLGDTPSLTYPTVVEEAVASRLFAYREGLQTEAARRV